MSVLVSATRRVRFEDAEATLTPQRLRALVRTERGDGLLRVTLDPDSFLTFGYGSDLDVLVFSSRVMTLSKEGYNVARYTEKPLVSGFAWQRMQRALAGRAYLVQENLGSGHLVLFAEDPNFRAGWEVTERLFLNAVLFGPSQ